MAFLSNPLVRRTILMMVVGGIALLYIIGLSLWLSARTESHAEEVVNAREVRTAAADLLSLLQDMEIGQRGYLLSQDSKYLAPYEDARKDIPPALERIRKLVANASAEVLARIRVLTENKAAELAETVALQKEGLSDAALDIVTSGRGKTYMDELRSILNTLIADSESLVRRRLAEMQWTTSALRWVSLVAGLLIVVATIGAGWTIARYTQELLAAQVAIQNANASLEERVQRRTSDLSRANEEIQRFAYIVSHDLRAPLVNILGFTSELESSLKSFKRYMDQPEGAPPDQGILKEARLAADTDVPEALSFIRASTGKMDKLINAILTLSRQGRRELKPERVDLATLLQATAASVQHQLEEKGGSFAIMGALPTVHSDRLALEQIFGNLIDNAVKYSAAGRPIRIEMSGTERRGWVTLKIVDNGRGIARDDYERIFDLFRRAGVQDTTGEGIGLAHVRALVRRLGGDISVESELGKGSTFTVILPKTFTPSA